METEKSSEKIISHIEKEISGLFRSYDDGIQCCLRIITDEIDRRMKILDDEMLDQAERIVILQDKVRDLEQG